MALRWVRLGAAVLAALLASGANAQRPFFAPDAALIRVATVGTHAEGPAEGPDGRIYFCDITVTRASGMEAGAIYAYDPASGRTTLFRSPSGMAAGIKFDARGDMVVTEGADFGGRAVVRTDRVSGRSYILAGLYEGRPFNAPNDLAIDRQGRIYFTDPRYFGHEEVDQPVFGVYRIDWDGSVHRIASDLDKPNGIALSPDQRTLYVADDDNGVIDPIRKLGSGRYGRMQIVAYDLSPAGTLSRRRVLVDFQKAEGADGLAVDARGNLYAAVRDIGRPGVRVYDSSGRELAYLATPDKPTNVALVGRDDAATLYVTAGKMLYHVRAPFGPPPQRAVRKSFGKR